MSLCTVCGLPLEVGDYPCILTPRPHRAGINGAIGDECDFIQENGLRDPRRFTSKAEFRRWLNETNQQLLVRHQPVPGTDKSPHTTDWSKGSMDAVTLENARILTTRTGGTKKDSSFTWPVRWTVGVAE